MLRAKNGGLQSWETPSWLFDALNRVFSFSLDAAASKQNAKCKKYYTSSNSGLTHPWTDTTFCNPPWKDIGPWVNKAVSEAKLARRSVLLLPAIGMTAKWYLPVRQHAHTTILHPRIAYDGPGGSPNGGSMLMLFGFSFSDGSLSFLDVSELRPGRRMVDDIRKPTGYGPNAFESLKDRLLKKSRLVGACVEWTGPYGRDGYGRITWHMQSWRVPRLAWVCWRGPIPEGQHVLHKCDNPRCFNIKHLWLGTISDNMLDCARKGRLPPRSNVTGRFK